jgi:hypothetical protein
MISRLNAGVPMSRLAAALLALFALDNILLLAFLGLSPLLTVLALVIVCPIVAIAAAKAIKTDIIVPWRGLAVAAGFALALYALGGEGRFFYANADWQVRDAILVDMARYPWPFAYQIDDQAALLRAPIGLYLLPALAGGGWHEIAMLLSNALRLTLLFALCWPLVSSNRARWIALVIFLLFSGWDIAGTGLASHFGANPSWDHIERWNLNNQFSAHITQVFWVPQHALAGWTCAVAFLLWHRNLVRIGFFAATIPLAAIWSPLAIMGAIPFALLAGLTVLRNRDWGLRDVMLALFAVVIALPALIYLQLDAAALGSQARSISVQSYALLISLEVLPLIIVPLLVRTRHTSDRGPIWIIIACLLATPLYQIGTNSDFQMRASIISLALLSYFFALSCAKLWDDGRGSRMAMIGAGLVLAVGAVTPMLEVRRALMFDPAPRPLCSLIGMWDKQKGLKIAPYASYFARMSSIPKILRPAPVTIAGLDDPEKCWNRDWPAIES